ncbi:MAG: DUF4397 domain-containing protein [Emticicia sp.]|nr:DUF4397 domain-containing protein [Emticicia sp.]
MKKYILSISLLTTMLLGGCGEESSFLTQIIPAEGAKVKFMHAAPDAPGVAIFVNDKKVSGALTVAPTTPNTIAYGGVFPANDYAVLPSGAANIKIITPTLSGATLLTGTANLESGKNYTVIATGLAPTYTPLVIEDKIPEQSGNKAFFRIINLISNSVDLEVNIAGSIASSGVKPNQGGDNFIAYEIPNFTNTAATVPVKIKINGTATPTMAGTVTASLFTATTNTVTYSGVVPGRVYTIVMRGLLGTQTLVAGKPVVTPARFVAGVSAYTNR